MNKSCPYEERVVDYFEGRLSEEDSSQLETHLSECPDCLEAFVVLKKMVTDIDQFRLEPVPNSVTESAVKLVLSQGSESSRLIERFGRSIREMISQLTDMLRGPWGVMQPVPVRGSRTCESEELVCYTVSFKGIKTDIEVERAGDDKAHIRVKPANAMRYIKGLRVTLKKTDREIASYRLEETYVVFEDIPLGRYSISLIENSTSLGTYHFEVKDTREGSE